MERVQLFVLLVITTVVSATSQATDSSAARSRAPKVSSEFGYRLQNAHPTSSQFRQEHRDADGNVRGSYGFENPNGRFRFVHYVADDKGFRAHISSNEPGVGRQNPASVSINRYEHQSVFVDDPKPTLQPPVSGLRQQSSEQRKEKVVPHPSRYDFYSPIEPEKTESDKTSVLDYPYRPIINEHSFQRSPVEDLIRTKLDFPEALLPDFHSGLTDNLHSTGEPDPLSLHSLYRAWMQRDALHSQKEQPDRASTSSYVPDNVLPKLVSSGSLRTRAQAHDYAHDYAQVSNVHANMKHKVHTSLPDCSSASSAVLCKPPNLLSDASRTQSLENLADMSVRDALKMLSARVAVNSEASFNELRSNARPPMPSHASRGNFNYKPEWQNHQECDKNHLSAADKDMNYSTLSQRSSEDHNVLASHDKNVPYSQQSQRNDRDDIEYSPSLVQFLQNNQNLDKLKQILSKTPQSSTGPIRQTPGLSLLGILILPTNILDELNHNTDSGTKNTKPEVLGDTSSSPTTFGLDAPGSGAAEQPANILEDETSSRVKNKPETDIHEYPLSKNALNETAVGDLLSPPYLSQNMGRLPPSDQTNDSQIGDSAKGSGFYIFDDPEFIPDDKNARSSANLTSDNWRKILEEEMKKDYERTSSQQDNNGAIDSVPDQRQHLLDDDVSPLYDSTGRPIKRENVPIHIHRLNLPSGMTSLPWKFSIPRPGPPRGVVIPPKP